MNLKDNKIARPVALFINNINIDPNTIDDKYLREHILLTKIIKENDNESINLITKGFMKKESCYKLFSFGEISSKNENEKELDNINKKELYKTFIQELKKADSSSEKNANKNITNILSIGFPFNNLDCVFEIYDLGLTPVFGNGDILFLDDTFYMCHKNNMIEIKSDELKEIIN